MTASASHGIGLALSGGAARGIAHIAVLEVLEEEGIPVHAVAGTSAGSIVGALYAAGMPLFEIRRIALATSWTNVLRFTIPRTGLISSEGIRAFIENILPVKNFSELVIPFAAVAADLGTGEKVDITTGPIARAVQASCSLPVVFTPTEIRKKMLVDGGVASQIPVMTARETLGAKIVAAVNVNFRGMESDRLDNLVSIAAHLSALWATRNARDEEKLADVVIAVNARGIPLYDLSKARELLRRGRAAAAEQVPRIKAILRRSASTKRR